jgi:hypothetical protein
MPAIEFALALDFLAGLHTHDSSQKISAALAPITSELSSGSFSPRLSQWRRRFSAHA